LEKQPRQVQAQAREQQPPLQTKQQAVANTNNKNNEQPAQLNFKTIQKQRGGLANVEQRQPDGCLIEGAY
jgi:hypothetical protein